MPNMTEAIQQVRNLAVPMEQLNQTAKVRRRLLVNHDVVTTNKLIEEYGVHPTFLHGIRRHMEHAGFKFECLDGKGVPANDRRWRVTNPDHEVPADYTPIKVKVPRAKKRTVRTATTAPRPSTNGKKPPVPTLDDTFEVSGVARSRDGEMVINFQNDGGTYQCVVKGYASAAVAPVEETV